MWGSHAALRADVIYRDYHDFYVSRTDTTTGKVTDKLGRTFDLTLVENSDHLKRRYAGLNTQATFRAASLDAGVNYTLSHAWGNVDGESASAGPTSDSTLSYPEYKQPSWNSPEGDLSIDQRHRARVWANYGLPWVRNLSIGVLETLETGVPYAANRPRGQLHARASRTAAAVRTDPGDQSVQPVPVVRVRRIGVGERRRSDGRQDRSNGPDVGHGTGQLRDVQSVYDDSRARGELGRGADVRQRAEPDGVYVAARVARVVRRQVLISNRT
jgi:hypothetical protein